MNNLQKLAQQQLNKLNGRSNIQDKYIQMPEGKTGVIVVRILPAAEENDLPWVMTRLHRNVKTPGDPGKGHTVHCPREQGSDGYWRGDCPICDVYSGLWNMADNASTEDEADQYRQFARDIKPRLRVYYNAIQRKWTNPRTGDVEENVGPRILSNGEKLHTKTLTAICGDEATETEPLGDITDFSEGCDFKIIKKTQGNFPNYDDSVFLPPSPAGTKAEIKEWMNNLWNLKELRRIQPPDRMQYYAALLQGKVDEESFDFGKNSVSASVPSNSSTKKEEQEEAPFNSDDSNDSDDNDDSSDNVSSASVSNDIDDNIDDLDDIDMSIVGDDFMDDIDKILKKKS